MSYRRHSGFPPVIAAAAFALGSGGCAATEERRPHGVIAPEAATGGGGGAGGAGAAGGGGAPSAGGGIAGITGGIDLGGGSQGGIDEGASCAQASAETELMPLDMLILLDRSGSMLGAKWDGVTSALTSFVTDAASAGISVGLTYFPRTSTGMNDCERSSYEELAVSIGELPQNARALASSIDRMVPGGGTPMRPALEGVLFNATAHKDANPTHKVIVVLATDGDPSGCVGNTVASTAEIATRALNYNGVQTFVIAVEGSTLSHLDQIAAAGGTTRAFDVTADIAAFSAKMADIRASALPCELLIPAPPAGAELDYRKVAVRFTSGAGSALEIPKADGAGDCGAGPGWYYDRDEDPERIILCPAACTSVQRDMQAKLDVLFGCEPKLN